MARVHDAGSFLRLAALCSVCKPRSVRDLRHSSVCLDRPRRRRPESSSCCRLGPLWCAGGNGGSRDGSRFPGARGNDAQWSGLSSMPSDTGVFIGPCRERPCSEAPAEARGGFGDMGMLVPAMSSSRLRTARSSRRNPRSREPPSRMTRISCESFDEGIVLVRVSPWPSIQRLTRSTQHRGLRIVARSCSPVELPSRRNDCMG